MEWMRRWAPIVFIVIAVTFVGGFLLVDSAGLLGRSSLTPTTAVVTVNGEDILATRWFARTQQLEEEQTQGTGTSLNLDDRERLADRAFEELVTAALLRQEYRRRGITVTDEEVRSAALYAPPPDLMQNPELQTDGRFDPEKYRRFLASPAVRQQGLLVQLEEYYRTEIPRQKLFEQVAGSVYLSDHTLWLAWQTRNDSTRVSFVRFDPELIPDAEITVTDAEIRDYYNRNRDSFDRPTRAFVSVMVIPRATTAADTADTRARAVALRQEIVVGTRTFEEVARTESADSASAERGGDLGAGPRGRFVDAFEDAAYALQPGEMSQPVLSPFGYHLIRVDSRTGDSLSVRHILLRIQQREAAAAATDRRADSLSRMAGSADDPRRFDDASRALGLPISRGMVLEGDAFTLGGRYIPSVSAWATTGARTGDVSELFDWDEGYSIARVDSLIEGGTPRLEAVREQIHGLLARLKKLDRLVVLAAPFARTATSTSLEQAAETADYTVERTGWFTRIEPVEGLGRVNEAIGAAFRLPVGTVSAPIRAREGVFVMRVDQRVEADSAAFEAAKTEFREQETETARQEAVGRFMRNLRENAKVVDRRREIAVAQRDFVPQ